jgi:NAD(P)-dependent dehydrogenase (short-subunit alcohol dehydrogenase family)
MAPLQSGFAIVTPASRGLGFALAQHLLAHTNLPVVATARADCHGVRDRLLKTLKHGPDADKRLSVVQVDVTGISTTWLQQSDLLTSLIVVR